LLVNIKIATLIGYVYTNYNKAHLPENVCPKNFSNYPRSRGISLRNPYLTASPDAGRLTYDYGELGTNYLGCLRCSRCSTYPMVA